MPQVSSLNRNYLFAGGVALFMVLWLGSGFIFKGGDDKADAKAPKLEKLQSVRAKSIYAEDYSLTVSVKARTEANRVVEVKAEVAGQVEKVPVAKGAIVDAGEVICQLAVEDRGLRLSEAEANLAQRKLEYDGALKLKSSGYQSEVAIANAKAALVSAEANVLRRKLDLEKTAIRAPFAGIVDRRPAEEGDLMRAGDTCARILDMDPLIVSGQVSEDEVVGVRLGGEADVRLLTGDQLLGNVSYISRESDSVTRTFRVEAALANPSMSVPSGITAEMTVFVQSIPAHLISASVLALGDDGGLLVRVLEEGNRVKSYPIDILGDNPEGIWVAGLPQESLLITVGQEYVGEGEEVEVTLENAPSTNMSASE